MRQGWETPQIIPFFSFVNGDEMITKPNLATQSMQGYRVTRSVINIPPTPLYTHPVDPLITLTLNLAILYNATKVPKLNATGT